MSKNEEEKFFLVMGKGPEEGYCFCAGCGGKCPWNAYDDDTNTYVCNECNECGACVCYGCFDPEKFPDRREKYIGCICPECAEDIFDNKLVYADDVLEQTTPAKRAKRDEEKK